MIKKLQHRFILLTMSCIGFIFLLILLILNISMTASSQKRGFDLLSEYVRNKNIDRPRTAEHYKEEENLTPDKVPAAFKPRRRPNDWFNDMRIFSVLYDSAGEVKAISTNNNPNLSEDDLLSLADTILKKQKSKGKIAGCLYLYIASEEGDSVYFLDYEPEREMSMQLWRVCLWVGLAGMLIILIPVIFLSRWIAKPVQLAFDRQKQFIADASHELKTPLTIITTNAEVLESTLPDNKWLHYILEQSTRMKILINSLLDLARLDSGTEKNAFQNFDLSKTVRRTALSFESLAYEYKKKYDWDIADGLSLYGNEENIKQLVTILLDNAFKYSDTKGVVTISLTRSADKKLLIVHNTGNGIDKNDLKHIFERFYRIDSSRSRQSGGYGLGLSIAESIVKNHKGQINVKSDGKSYTDFCILLP
ncbi:MAG: HAMP domain-containing histidine kinase [Lachnospiraceae bacterium]|nr:HAMP domain-containing histidine kinase [Lachnospiraceae bacterium]